ncbi:MAG: substrate-binding domain-containing protein [Kiritimatiellae bacterium]|nr:substrate-binding domain-containing protein [Kiritimatiellia bacterium]
MKNHGTVTIRAAADFSKTSGRDFMAGVLRYMRETAGWRLSIAQSAEEFSPSRIKAAIASGVCGIITSMAEPEAICCALRNAAVPVVLVGCRHDVLKPRQAPYSLACVNEEGIGAKGAEYLLSLGRFATFAYVHCPDELDRTTSVRRKREFRRELQRHDFGLRSFAHVSDADAVGNWLNALPKPAAVLAGHDMTAKAVVEACHRENLAIPDEVSVLGIDNDMLVCESLTPSLSSIDIDLEGLGFAATAELAHLVRMRRRSKRGPGDGTVTRRELVVNTRIRVVERESTHHVTPAMHLIEKAQAYIAANRDCAITVKDVVKHLGVSRRLVDLRFRQYAGETVLQAITKARLAAAAERLRSSHVSVARVVRPLGFRDIPYFSALFRRCYGQSPAVWRNARQGKKGQG